MSAPHPPTVGADEVGLLRLAALGLAGPPDPTVAGAVRRLGAVQAQDLPGAMTSLALRSAARSRDAVVAAFDAGEIVRSWPMRGTLHVVPAEDLGWMLPLGTARPLAAAAARRAELGLDDAALARARELALGALVERALRYFRGHGPATTADYARWTGLLAADVRAGLAGAREHLEAVVVDGVVHLMDPATPARLAAHREDARALRLLPGFDEFVLGYRDRSAVLAPAFADRIVPGGNGVFRATVVHEGRIVGTWKPVGRGARRTAEVGAFTDLPSAVTDAVAAVFARLP